MDICKKEVIRLTMWQHMKFGNVLLWLGPILVFVTIGIVLICIGVCCFIVANHLKKSKI